MKHEEKLIDDGKYGNTFKNNFTFKIHHAGTSGIDFNPNETLPELGEPYYAGMKFSANADGRTFEGLLPLALSGEKPKLPSVVAWEEAYAKLKKDVRYFGLDNDPHLKELIREVRAKNVSASDLEHVRRYLLLCAVSYYEKCNREYEKIDAVMSRYIVVSSAMVKAGDLAIEFLITKVWPKELGGGIFAKFVLPLKDMFCTYAGQRLSFFAGEPERGEFESVSLIGSLTDSVLAALEESITGKMKPDPDTLGYIVAAYIFISFLKHYFGDDPYEKGDIYRSMVAAGKDLTFAKIKAWFAGEISKATGAVFDKIGKFFGTYFKSLCSGSVQKIVNAAGDKAFQASIRESIQSTGGVSTVQYILAKGLKTTAMETEATVQRWIINEGAKNVSEIVGQTTSMAVGTATNLLFGGTNKDGEVYGVTVEDVITGYIAERWKAVGVKVYNMINNPLDSSIRVEDGCLKLGVCGYYIEFPIAENLPVIIDSVFTVCFDWMKSLWDAMVDPPTTVEDLRDRLEKNTDVVEEQVRRLENMKPIEFRKEANYTPWGGTE